MKNNPTTHFIGIGHGSQFMVETFWKAKLEGDFYCIMYPHGLYKRYYDKEGVALPEGIKLIPYYPPAQKVTLEDGIEIFRLPDWSQAPEITPEIMALFRKGERYILLPDFGDYTGVRLTEALTEWLHQRRFSFRVLVLYKSVSYFNRFGRIAPETKGRLDRFEEFECLKPRELPGVGSTTTIFDLLDFQNSELLRLYREGKH